MFCSCSPKVTVLQVIADVEKVSALVLNMPYDNYRMTGTTNTPP